MRIVISSIIISVFFIGGLVAGNQRYIGSQKPEVRSRKPEVNDSCMFRIIDSIALDGIAAKAYPGCQIVVLKDGKAIYDKAFGYATYENKRKVEKTDLYDIASLTKVAATTICIMKLTEERQINPDDRLEKYLPELKNSNKSDITIREVMAHQAGLKSWIPFYKNALSSHQTAFSDQKSSDYSIQVAEHLFMRNDYRDTIFKEIINSEVTQKKKYLYSDIGFILLAEIIKRVTGKTIDEYVTGEFYKPMGLKRITYQPLNNLLPDEIIPTSRDTVFRKQVIHGYVHDPACAMLGGVSGHAGVFSDAMDLALLMQMLLQNGTYKGHAYLKVSTVKEFTRCQYPENGNRRGLGFDKPLLPDTGYKSQGARHIELNGPCCPEASNNSYGHSGFTGTFVWVDPDYKMVYVFLSNRVYPDENNRKLAEMNIRTKIQQAIYEGRK